MNILLICTRFPLEPGNEYLTNELAAELVLEGNNVDAVVLDWDAPPGQRTFQRSLADGVNVTVIAPRSVRGLGRFVERGSKWLMSSLFALREIRSLLSDRRFDGLICFSPATTVAAPAIWAMRAFQLRSYLVQWDFFPFHQRSIGLMGNPFAFAIAYWLEQAVIRRFDAIGCMSPMNIAYLRAKFGPRPTQAVERLPIWGKISAPPSEPAARVRAEYDLPASARIVVFGGQITEGRGVEDVLEAAQLASLRRPDLCFLVIGRGRLAGLVKDISRAAAPIPLSRANSSRRLFAAAGRLRCRIGSNRPKRRCADVPLEDHRLSASRHPHRRFSRAEHRFRDVRRGARSWHRCRGWQSARHPGCRRSAGRRQGARRKGRGCRPRLPCGRVRCPPCRPQDRCVPVKDNDDTVGR